MPGTTFVTLFCDDQKVSTAHALSNTYSILILQ
jgi:hypothetical protein